MAKRGLLLTLTAAIAMGCAPGSGPAPPRPFNSVPAQSGREFKDFPLQGGQVEPGDIVALRPDGGVGDAIIRRETLLAILRRNQQGLDSAAVRIAELGRLPYTRLDRRSSLERSLSATASSAAEAASLRAAVQRASRVEQHLFGGRVIGLRDGRYALLVALDAMSLQELQRLRDAFDLGGTPALITQVEVADSATLLVDWGGSVGSAFNARIPGILELSGRPQVSADSAELRMTTSRPIATGYKDVVIPKELLERRIEEKRGSASREEPEEQPSNRVAAWNASLIGMLFFEFSGLDSEIPPPEAREYRAWFDSATTREVGVELRFALPPASQPERVLIVCDYLNEGTLRTAIGRTAPDEGWTRFHWTPGATLGFVARGGELQGQRRTTRSRLGSLEKGRYDVRCRAEGRLLGRGSFEVG